MKSEIVVDVSEGLLKAVDDWANYLSISREELVVDALESYLRRKSEAKAIAETREIYATIAPEDRATAEAYIPLIDESLPAFGRQRVCRTASNICWENSEILG